MEYELKIEHLQSHTIEYKPNWVLPINANAGYTFTQHASHRAAHSREGDLLETLCNLNRNE